MAGWLQDAIKAADRLEATVRLGLAYLDAPTEEREVVRRGWDFGAVWPYPDPDRLSCLAGERFSPRQRIVTTLVLESLEEVFGTREHAISLAATYRSCELAGLSPGSLFEEVAVALPKRHAQELRSFLARKPEDRALSSFGLTEKENSDGETRILWEH